MTWCEEYTKYIQMTWCEEYTSIYYTSGTPRRKGCFIAAREKAPPPIYKGGGAKSVLEREALQSIDGRGKCSQLHAGTIGIIKNLKLTY